MMIDHSEISCGIYQLFGLEYDFSIKNLKETLKNHCVKYPSILIACVTKFQKREEKLLKQAGFKKSASILHRGTNNINNIYILEVRKFRSKYKIAQCSVHPPRKYKDLYTRKQYIKYCR